MNSKERIQPDSLILLFVRLPEKGKTKTRLAADIGEETALTIYKLFVSDILMILRRGAIPFRICFFPPDAVSAMQNWLGNSLDYRGQDGEDLGERMKNAFVQSFREKFGRVLIIGSDIPDLTEDIIVKALSSLEMNDAVIGPAFDGGYYLIGFRKHGFLIDVFDGIPWSTDNVFRETMAALYKRNRSVQVLPRWRDIDTLSDLESLYRRGCHTSFLESQTMSFLSENKKRLFPISKVELTATAENALQSPLLLPRKESSEQNR